RVAGDGQLGADLDGLARLVRDAAELVRAAGLLDVTRAGGLVLLRAPRRHEEHDAEQGEPRQQLAVLHVASSLGNAPSAGHTEGEPFSRFGSFAPPCCESRISYHIREPNSTSAGSVLPCPSQCCTRSGRMQVGAAGPVRGPGPGLQGSWISPIVPN